jgi:hypothetical protein
MYRGGYVGTGFAQALNISLLLASSDKQTICSSQSCDFYGLRYSQWRHSEQGFASG